MVKKVSKYICILYKIRKFFDRSSLLLIYHSLIFPNITYCISAWGNTGVSKLRPLNICLNRIVRSICGASRRTSAAPLYRSLRLFSLNFIYRYMAGNYVHKLILRGESNNWLTYRVEHYPTRQSRLQLLHVNRALSSHSEQSITIAGPKVYNTIPLDIRSRESYDLFKYHKNKYLMSIMQI